MSDIVDARPRLKILRATRELTALVISPIVIWIIGWAPPLAFVVMIALIASLALYEFLVLGEAKGYPVHKFLSTSLMLLILAAALLENVEVEAAIIAVLLLIPASYVFSEPELEGALPASAVCVLGTLYVGLLAGTLIRLHRDFGGLGPELVFFLLLVVWMGDAGAYYFGRLFGKTPLSRISPKKTVEGSIGGMITSVMTAATIHFTFFPEFPLGHALVAAALLSASGVVGDLAESLWKRSAAVKDSGKLLPGHGGAFDRIDSVLFTAPILYGYWFFITEHQFLAR
jgi:phosphatidate cytidylyltransferase